MVIRLNKALDTQDPALFSWWQQDIRRQGNISPCPHLAGRKTVDIAIVGGGYTGLWTALTLRQRAPSLSVAVVDAGRCGDGASSRNGGNVHGYWGAMPALRALLGADRAIEVARLGTIAQESVRAFACGAERETWWREEGYLRVAASQRQLKNLHSLINTAGELGLTNTVRPLTNEEVSAYCSSPPFLGGALFSEGATVHPARLAAALREAVINAGVQVYEGSAVTAVDPGTSSQVQTAHGEIIAREVVLANYTGTLALSQVRARTTLFSSFPVMSNPAPEGLAARNWTKPHGIADLRMFQHYFRRTLDGRVLMGSGSGPMGRGDDDGANILRQHEPSTRRAMAGLKRFFPDIAAAGIAAKWGWPIEVSSDRLPFFGTVAGTRVHFASGYSGHGVNATYIAGQCVASLILGVKDKWSTSPFCTRTQPKMPPEPFRFLGGRAIQWGVLSCEDAEDCGLAGSLAARFVADLPKRLGLRIGVR